MLWDREEDGIPLSLIECPETWEEIQKGYAECCDGEIGPLAEYAGAIGPFVNRWAIKVHLYVSMGGSS